MAPDLNFGKHFPPQSVGIVGISSIDNPGAPGYSGLKLFRNLRTSGYQGQLYPVNPRTKEIDGTQTFSNLMAVPVTLDLVVITVPAAIVPKVLEDCITAKVRNVQICSSGFGETGTEEGRLLDDTIKEIILRGNLRVIGPNCMGFHVPAVKYRMFEELDLMAGPVAFISQSGGHARTFLLHCSEYGIGCSKVISFGNALTLEAVDFLEYLSEDPETGIICMYLEGTKDGKRLLSLVKRVNPMKPVIIWKAGLTEPGARASASHTGSLKGDKQIWKAFFKQTGAIQVGSLEELSDSAMSFLKLKPFFHSRTALLGVGGGVTVANGDICGEEGIETPSISEVTRQGMAEYIQLVNQGLANPLDIPVVVSSPEALGRTLELLTADPKIDVIIICVAAEFLAGAWGDFFPGFRKALSSFIQGYQGSKPIVVAVEAEGCLGDTERYTIKLREAGIVAYSSLRRACRALKRFAGYQRVKEMKAG